MTAFPSRLWLFRTLASLGPLMLTWLLLLPTEAVSRPLAVDEQQTVEISNPRGSNPNGPREITRGKQIADAVDKVKSARASAAGKPRPLGLEQLANVQTLYAQRHIEDKANTQSRSTDVYYYDYTQNEVIKVVVDLDRNAVRETRVASGVANQPFFTSLEIKAALQLILNDPQEGLRIRTAYKKVTGQDLVSVSQLNAQGGVFHPDPGTALGAVTAACKQDRCMQLFVPIDDKRYIDTTYVVVDLSKGKVLSVAAGITGHSH